MLCLNLFELIDVDKSDTVEIEELVRVLHENEEAAALAEQLGNFRALLDRIDAASAKKGGGSRKKQRRSSVTDMKNRRKEYREKRANAGIGLKTINDQILESGLLKKIQVFKDAKVTDDGLKHLANNMELRKYRSGDVICTEAEAPRLLRVLAHARRVCDCCPAHSRGETTAGVPEQG